MRIGGPSFRAPAALAAAALTLAACVSAPTMPRSGAIAPSGVATAGFAARSAQCGGASWYALTGRTASGERADPASMSAAHPTLPFGTRVRVTNLGNGRSVVVRVNDRGPFTRGRIIDVTKAAASELGFVRQGTAQVRIEADGLASGSTCS